MVYVHIPFRCFKIPSMKISKNTGLWWHLLTMNFFCVFGLLVPDRVLLENSANYHLPIYNHD